jgi:signal transduction histidine kinase
MRTIVGRLTVGYAIALAATMFVFSGAMYLLQAERFSEIDDRLLAESNIFANIVFNSPAEQVIEPDSLGNPVLGVGLRNILETVEDYVLVVDGEGAVYYASGPAADVHVTGGTLVITGAEQEVLAAVLGDLAEIARPPVPEAGFDVHEAGPPIGTVRYYRRHVTLDTVQAGILMAAAVSDDGAGRLVVALLVIGPIILLASTGLGFVIAGRTLRPMDIIINEIEAITDGRSLHRRVMEVKSTEELARLTTTINNTLVRLERNFLSLRRFTAEASHELKTPLTVFRSGVERAITHPEAPPEVLEVLEEALVEVNRMTELVDSLLTLARADEGRAPLHLEQVDIRALLAEVAETAGMLGEQAQINVSVEVPKRSIFLPLDRNRVRQLFMNLLTNAIKYTPRGGRVSIECQITARRVVFVVRDTGIGIASHELPHIFDRFWRADVARSRTGARSGAGLGLAICKWIAEAHGGTIVVESRRGQGSVFTVTLPLGEPD